MSANGNIILYETSTLSTWHSSLDPVDDYAPIAQSMTNTPSACGLDSRLRQQNADTKGGKGVACEREPGTL